MGIPVNRFLSTLPARGATWKTGQGWRAWTYFYPRSPRGERLFWNCGQKTQTIFLSTLPARGATLVAGADGDMLGISIHAPREGSDRAMYSSTLSRN